MAIFSIRVKSSSASSATMKTISQEGTDINDAIAKAKEKYSLLASIKTTVWEENV